MVAEQLVQDGFPTVRNWPRAALTGGCSRLAVDTQVPVVDAHFARRIQPREFDDR